MKVVVIGSGFAGLCMAIKLKEAGIDDFVIYEKDDQLGGTWYVNTYPGCACDVQSHLYSYSFELNPNWSRSFSPQPEICEYLEHCADKYDVRKHIQFNTPINEAKYNEGQGTWTVTTQSGEQVETQFLVTATGGLSIPGFPDIPGMNDFKGSTWHSAEWNHEFDLKGKKVAVIGTGASAIQIVPQIAKEAGELNLFQRTPPWVLPKPDFAFKDWHKKLFAKVPAIMWLYRMTIYWLMELSVLGFVFDPRIMYLPQRAAKKHIRKNVTDPVTQEKLTPKFTLGCKRVLLSNDYYPTFNLENVHLITESIDHIDESGVATKNGARYEVDAIIYATGFKATEFLSNIKVTGKNGRVLSEEWAKCPESYLGTTIAGFPNLFTFTGPNTGLGHSSIVIMMEGQVKYIMDCIKLLDKTNKKIAEVKQDVMTSYNKNIQETISKSVWQDGGCKSWYQTEDGRNPTLWPGFTFTYRLKTRKFDKESYLIS